MAEPEGDGGKPLHETTAVAGGPADPTDSLSAHSPGRLQPKPGLQFALLTSVFVIAACGLIYELLAGAIASYLLGDSILQFSTVIGAYLFAMGVGSYLSRFLVRDLPGHFVRIELLVGMVGGCMPVLLFVQHAWTPGPFRLLLYGMVLLVGILVGLEIPLVMRLLRAQYRLKDLVSQVLTFDYLGALAVSLAFPLFFIPLMGMVRTGLFFGLANVLIAGWALAIFWSNLTRPIVHLLTLVAGVVVLSAGMFGADSILQFAEARFYNDRVIYAASTPYQRIVLTRSRDDLRLHLNGNLQFSSRDEYRYHESLVMPALAAHPAPRRALILGGGDGLAARELLRHQTIELVSLVDLDKQVTDLFATMPALMRLNDGALLDSRVTIYNQDALSFLLSDRGYYDIIIVDLPDPTNLSLAKLYSQSFYSELGRHLAASGFAVVQSTSPLYAPDSFWSVVTTIEAAGLQATPFHAVVPSFGVWGFVIASHRPYPKAQAVARLTSWPTDNGFSQRPKFLSGAVMMGLFDFPPDMNRTGRQTDVNRLQDPVLLRHFQREWGAIEN